MIRHVRTAVALSFVAFQARAQNTVHWRVQGDTMGAPAGCSASAGIAALNQLIAALNTADSGGFSRALATRHPQGFVFSMSKGFTLANGSSPTDTFFAGRSIPEIIRYARNRARFHERLRLQAVTFNGWRGRALQFGPVYFLRSADDLGKRPREGNGKGWYFCDQGVGGLNLGPRAPLRPGERMRYDQRLP